MSLAEVIWQTSNHGSAEIFIWELQSNEEFGSVLATADFNSDGFTDLAIGVPEAFDNGAINGGAVHVIYGSSSGLTAVGNQYWTQAGGWVDETGSGTGLYLGDIYGGLEDYDRFGSALAAGDFNNDTFPDLAIGVKGEDIGSIGSAGAVNVLYGSAAGLTWINNQFWSQDGGQQEQNGTNSYAAAGDLLAGSETGDGFGSALAAGDINNDGYDELVIGVANEAIGSLNSAGALHILRGADAGLTAVGNQHWHQQAAYIDTDGNGTVDVTIGNPDGTEETGDFFATTLALADFNNDQYADLAIGVPNEDLWINGVEKVNTGVVQVFYGTVDGLTLSGSQFWQQNGEYATGSMFGSSSESGDKFGTSLTTGNLNGDAYTDLIVGTPNEGFSSTGADVGSVNIIYGSSAGLNLPNHQWISQGLVLNDQGSQLGALVGVESADNEFGAVLTTADFDSDGYDDLAIGIPFYQPASFADQTGAVSIMRGSQTGLLVPGNQLWRLDRGLDDQGAELGDLVGGDADGNEFGGGLP